MSKYGDPRNLEGNAKVIGSIAYDIVKYTATTIKNNFTDDEYEYEKGEESATNEFLREAGSVSKELMQSFWDIVVRGK